jgi:hypothetical protein
VCLFAGIALVDVPSILHNRQRRELIVYLTVLAAALAMAIVMASGIKIPSALDALANLFEWIFGKIYPQ